MLANSLYTTRCVCFLADHIAAHRSANVMLCCLPVVVCRCLFTAKLSNVITFSMVSLTTKFSGDLLAMKLKQGVAFRFCGTIISIQLRSQLLANRKLYVDFRLEQNSMTSNDPERSAIVRRLFRFYILNFLSLYVPNSPDSQRSTRVSCINPSCSY